MTLGHTCKSKDLHHCPDQVYPRLENDQTGVLPAGSFLTASSDDTIRVWNLDPQMSDTPGYKRNIYSSVSINVQSTFCSRLFWSNTSEVHHFKSKVVVWIEHACHTKCGVKIARPLQIYIKSSLVKGASLSISRDENLLPPSFVWLLPSPPFPSCSVTLFWFVHRMIVCMLNY